MYHTEKVDISKDFRTEVSQSVLGLNVPFHNKFRIEKANVMCPPPYFPIYIRTIKMLYYSYNPDHIFPGDSLAWNGPLLKNLTIFFTPL